MLLFKRSFAVSVATRGTWQTVLIDERLPCAFSSTGKHELLFAHSISKELWVPLLEKAYAKARGTYRAISGGYPNVALQDLTGWPSEYIPHKSVRNRDKFWEVGRQWPGLGAPAPPTQVEPGHLSSTSVLL